MARSTAASGTAVFVDAVVLRQLLAPLLADLAALRQRHAEAEADTQQVAMLKTLLAEAREARDIWFQRYTVAAERLTFAEAELRALRPTT